MKFKSVDSRLLPVALSVALVTGIADAQKMYKVVDEDGRVSYQDTPPNSDLGSVEERHVNESSSRLSPTPSTAKPAEQSAPQRPDAASEVTDADSDSTESPNIAIIPEQIDADDQKSAPDADSNATAEALPEPPPDPDGPRPEDPRSGRDGASAEITILDGDESNTDSRQNSSSPARPNSRGRRPAPVAEKAPQKRLTTDELEEIARSLNEDD